MTYIPNSDDSVEIRDASSKVKRLVPADSFGTADALTSTTGINWISGIDSFPSDLKAIPTVSLPAPVGTNPYVLGFQQGTNAYFYRLSGGSNAEDSPYIIRPNDYDAGTPRIWLMLRPYFGTLNVSENSFLVGPVWFGSNDITFDALPTSDPAEAGRLWNDSNTLKISAG